MGKLTNQRYHRCMGIIRPIIGAVQRNVVTLDKKTAKLARNTATVDNCVPTMNGNRASRRYMPNAGKTAHHPKQMKIGDNAIIGTGPAVVSCDDPSSLQVMSADTQSRARQNAFSLVYVGKFASSSCAYRMKKYFILSLGTSQRPAYTFSGTPKCCINDVPPQRGICTKNRCLDSGRGGLASSPSSDLINQGIGTVGYDSRPPRELQRNSSCCVVVYKMTNSEKNDSKNPRYLENRTTPQKQQDYRWWRQKGARSLLVAKMTGRMTMRKTTSIAEST